MSETLKLVLLIGALILLGALFILLSRRRGLPEGAVIYEDLVRGGIRAEPLRSSRYGLSGQPDMLIRNGKQVIPVEVKGAEGYSRPLPSHVMQLASYCLLIREHYGICPEYGIIRYRDRQFEVPFTEEMEDRLLEMMNEMRKTNLNAKFPPKCGNLRKCAHCGFAAVCEDSAD